MHHKVVVIESAGAADIIFDTNSIGFNPASQPYNAQVVCTNLGGGTFDVLLSSPGGSSVTYQEHITDSTESDTVVLAGKEFPIFERVKVTFTNVPVGTDPECKLIIWARGI